MAALSIRWFGGPGQPPGICEVPLETFVSALDRLRAEGARRISVLGVSKGAEAALHLSVLQPGIDAVVALSPTSLTWANIGPGRDGSATPHRSSWTWRGQPLPFVPYATGWTAAEPAGAPVSVLGWYEQSVRAHPDLVTAAAIPVERSAAELVLGRVREVPSYARRAWPVASGACSRRAGRHPSYWMYLGFRPVRR
ncbi:hypothetical protein AAIO99_11155, partial [Streptomyces sp. AC154]